MLTKNRKAFMRFCIVGAINTAIDFGVFLTAHYAIGVGTVPSHVAGASLGILNSYFMNKIWTFEDSTPHNRQQIFKFLSIAFIGLALSSVTIYELQFLMPAFVAKTCAIAVTLIWNYAGNRLFVFSQRTRT